MFAQQDVSIPTRFFYRLEKIANINLGSGKACISAMHVSCRYYMWRIYLGDVCHENFGGPIGFLVHIFMGNGQMDGLFLSSSWYT